MSAEVEAALEFARRLLEQQPLLALFFTIAVGYLVGEVNIKGFSLGAGAVLFVALAVGAFAPGAAPAPMVGTLGLALFVYSVGVQYGRQFFTGLASGTGRRSSVMALTGVLLSGCVCLLLYRAFNVDLGQALGLFAGSGTSTPTLQAALVALGNDRPAISYAVSYPVGVAGPILILYIAFAALKPKLDASPHVDVELLETAVDNPHLFGRTLGEVMSLLPSGVRAVALSRGERNEPAFPSLIVAEHDVLLIAGPGREALDQAAKAIGRAASGRVLEDRSAVDYLRVFASRPVVVGRSLAALDLPGKKTSVVLHVRRGDTDLLSRPDLILEFGDRIGMLADRGDFSALRRFFGDSIKGTAEMSYISVGIGMALGFLLGAVSVPVPGIGKLSVGLSGLLLVALILGHRERSKGLNWTMPISANLVLRNLGVTLFLAQVGMASGPGFVATVAGNGLTMLVQAIVVLAALVLPILLLGLVVFRMPYAEVAGIVAGTCGNPAVFAYASKLAPGEQVDIGYATTFPGMTLAKILFIDLANALS